ncbi:MAG: PAS domain S-box protein, partial [Solirubrobacteraceae bacterium]
MLPPNATGQPPPATRRDPHADLQLRRELALFRGLVESAVHAIVVVAQSGEIVLVNAAAEALSGYRREELVGQGVELLVPEAMRAQHAARRARFDAQQGVRPMGIGLDVVLRRKDGSDVPVEIGLGRVQTDDGFLISAAISDISERKRTEATIAELERERTRLAEATEYCSDAVISIDLEQRVRHWNRGAERLYGYTAQEALGRTLHELTVSTYEPREHVARMVSGEDVYQYETRRRRKDGTIVDILLTISPWHLEGKVVGVTGVAIALRDQKERERERERLAAAAEHGADAVVSIDRDGIVRHWSHGAERL